MGRGGSLEEILDILNFHILYIQETSWIMGDVVYGIVSLAHFISYLTPVPT